MKSKSNLFLLIIATLVALGCKQNNTPQKNTPVYKDDSKSFEKRAAHLISLMTLEEKVSQMSYISPAIDRLEIPKYNWWNECLHGVARAGKATVFPQAIGMAAMFDRKLMGKIAEAISDEARAKHHEAAARGKRGIYQGLTFWTPNINIFRDPRWGRGMETYGEDPYLSGELAVPFIKGLQGNDPKYFKLIATAKHFAVHSGPEDSRHHFDVLPSTQDFLNTYTPHFKKTITQAKVYSVMCAYNAYAGKPCCGNKDLSDLLRNDWGFKGYIVSDCWAVRDFYDTSVKTHQVVESKKAAAAMAVKAGTDLNCGNSYPALTEAVKSGLISEAELNISLERLLVARLKLGLFAPEGAVSFEKIPFDVVGSEKHRLLTLEAARKSIVLLKNENKTLPLSKDLKNIAVIGSSASDIELLLANYNGFPETSVLPIQGIRKKLPNATVNYAIRCKLAPGLPVFEAMPTNVLFTDTSKKQQGLKAEYYNNTSFKGAPVHSLIEKNIDHVWWNNKPFPDMSYDQYAVRWSGILSVTTTGTYAIGAEAYNMNIYLDDKLLLEREHIHRPKKIYEYVTLQAGKNYKIRFEGRHEDSTHSIMRLLWEAPKNNLEQEALNIAKNADAIIFYGGISPLLEGEEMKVKVDGFSGGDRVHTRLPASQTALLKKLTKLGKPIVLVLLNGSALSINWEDNNIPAIVEGWYPGQEGGAALADVIFGDYNPAGRLPLTFYKSINDIPEFDNYAMKGKTYRYFKGTPLYEFGYGLSYTSFEYSNLKIPSKIKAGENIDVAVTITNTGKVLGEEVPQVYVTHPNADENNPSITLAGFDRITLQPGQQKTVQFSIAKEQLSLVNKVDGVLTQVVPSGDVDIYVGGAQPNTTRIKNKKVVSAKVTIIGQTVLN